MSEISLDTGAKYSSSKWQRLIVQFRTKTCLTYFCKDTFEVNGMF